jgi:hypothetical protein
MWNFLLLLLIIAKICNANEEMVIPTVTTNQNAAGGQCQDELLMNNQQQTQESSCLDTPKLSKEEAALRNYQNEVENSRVRKHYRDMRQYQTEEFTARMEQKFGNYDNGNMTIREAFKLLESYVDASDPDVSLPNVVHNFMAAEAARRTGMPDWMQLTAFLHDIGKMMFVYGEEKDGMSGRPDGRQFAL